MTMFWADETPPPENVQKVFAAFPETVQEPLRALRSLILKTASDLPEIGPLQETLKWGQPAYLTPEIKAATTIRLGVPKSGGYALYTHCQSRVIPNAQAIFGDVFQYDGSRAILFREDDKPDQVALRQVIISALRYHLPK